MSQERQEVHRTKIGVRAKSILGQFWVEVDRDEALETLEIEGWQDVLENCSHSEIRMAWATYQKTGPRTESGKLCKPDAGALYRIVMANKPKPKLAPKPAEKPRGERATPEEMAAIRKKYEFSEMPYTPKLRRMTQPLQNDAKTQENIRAAQQLEKEWAEK